VKKLALLSIMLVSFGARAQNPSPYIPQPTCPEGQVLEGDHCVAAAPQPQPQTEPPPPPPPPPPPRRGEAGDSCRTAEDCTSSMCSNGSCVTNAPPPPPQVVVEQQPSAPVVRESPSVPAPDTTRKWMFSDVITYDPTLLGIGDIFMIDIAIARLGNTNSSISLGGGVGIIASLASGRDANFAIPIPITVTGRFGIGTSIEIDAKIGAVPYFYSQNSKTDSWGGKLVIGAALRIPFSSTGGMGLLAGFDLYLINGTVPLPELGMTF
jgi:hypothetical protein